MGIDELPAEVLSELFDYVNDVYEFMNLVQVCKRFQTIIRNKVLIVTDIPEVSPFFKSIANQGLFMDDPNDLEKHNATIRSFSYFIVEFSKKHSHEKSVLADDYILNVVYNRSRKWQKVVRVLLTWESMEMLSQFSFHPEQPKFYQHSGLEYIKYLESQLMHVHRTICLYNRTTRDQEYDLSRSQLEVMGHDYDFFHAEELPRVYFHVNSKYDFTINSKTLKVLNGVVNTSMTVPRLPPLLKFLERSNIPNLTSIHDISIEAGLSLSIFEKFLHLQSLSLQSAFAGNMSLQSPLEQGQRVVTLPNLRILKITGNALSLSNIDLPRLESLSIQLFGSSERSFSETILFKDVKCPNLIDLDLQTGSVPEGFHHIVNELKSYIKKVETMSIATDSKTFPKAFEQLEFDNLIKLTLKHNEIEIVTDPPRNQRIIPTQETYEINPSKLIFPELDHLNLSNFPKFNSSFLNPEVTYPKLRALSLMFKVGEKPQRYRISSSNFPQLSKLYMEYSNRYGPLKEPDIVIEIDDNIPLKDGFFDVNLQIEHIRDGGETKG